MRNRLAASISSRHQVESSGNCGLQTFRLFDVGGSIGIAGMALMLVFFTAQNAARLYHEERIAP